MVRLALAAIAKNEGRYLPEWVAYHVLRGATHIRIYDNASSDGTADIVRDLSAFPVEVVHWPVIDNDFNITQKRAYEHAASALVGAAEFVAFIDIDEFLAGTPHKLTDALGAYNADVGAIACQQVMMGSSGHEEAGDDPVIARFTHSAAKNHPGHLWFKTVARPEMFEGMETVHSVRTGGAYVHADGSPLERPNNPRHASRICLSPIRLNHYFTKSRQEFAQKQQRMTSAKLPDPIRTSYSEEVNGFDARNAHLNLTEEFSLATYAPQVRELLRASRAS